MVPWTWLFVFFFLQWHSWVCMLLARFLTCHKNPHVLFTNHPFIGGQRLFKHYFKWCIIKGPLFSAGPSLESAFAVKAAISFQEDQTLHHLKMVKEATAQDKQSSIHTTSIHPQNWKNSLDFIEHINAIQCIWIIWYMWKVPHPIHMPIPAMHQGIKSRRDGGAEGIVLPGYSTNGALSLVLICLHASNWWDSWVGLNKVETIPRVFV